MARYDKYDYCAGGFRAPLAADFTGGANGADFGKVIAVGLDGNGRVTMGDGTDAPASGYMGVVILFESKKAGQPVDVMTRGEIVEFDQNLNGQGAPTPGTAYYANVTAADGTITNAAGSAPANTKIGRTVEATRLLVGVN